LVWEPESDATEAMIALESTTGEFPIVPFEYWLEEENFPHLFKDEYYPVKLGDALAYNFKVIGKLGFGDSTVWLTRALQ
jgi:hypothetical protein